MSGVKNVLISPNRWHIVSTVQALVFIVRCVGVMKTEEDEENKVLGHLFAHNILESMNIAGLGTAGKATRLLPPTVLILLTVCICNTLIL